jgi:hypothetical protein
MYKTEDKTDDRHGSLYEVLQCIFDQFPKNHMKKFLEHFKERVGREDIFSISEREFT